MFLQLREKQQNDFAVSMPQSFMNREISFLEVSSPLLRLRNAIGAYLKESRSFMAFLTTFSSPST